MEPATARNIGTHDLQQGPVPHRNYSRLGVRPARPQDRPANQNFLLRNTKSSRRLQLREDCEKNVYDYALSFASYSRPPDASSLAACWADVSPLVRVEKTENFLGDQRRLLGKQRMSRARDVDEFDAIGEGLREESTTALCRNIL